MKYSKFILLMLLLVGCSKNSSENGPEPGKSQLLTPAQNEACNTGVVISNTESKVTFSWSSAPNADSYELRIKNLLTNTVSNQITTEVTKDVTLNRNTPYSWWVVSRSSKSNVLVESDTWRFYNSGPASSNYAPFPADILSPTINQRVNATAGKITLQWSGSDVDNNIASYDVYFSTSSNPVLLQSNLSNNITQLSVNVNSSSTYYWKIITKDSKGDSSDSGVFSFTVN